MAMISSAGPWRPEGTGRGLGVLSTAVFLLALCGAAGQGVAQTKAAGGANAAGLAVKVVPDAVTVGTTFAFNVTSVQAGYLVLLDINAEGSVSQLYPNVFSMKLSNQRMAAGADPCVAPAANTLSSFGLQAGATVQSNRIDAGQSFDLPGDRSGADYAFQACPPKGVGVVVAVMSDRPVQIIDLPDIPASAVGQQAGIDRLISALQALRLVSGDQETGPAAAPRWSVAWAAYTIR